MKSYEIPILSWSNHPSLDLPRWPCDRTERLGYPIGSSPWNWIVPSGGCSNFPHVRMVRMVRPSRCGNSIPKNLTANGRAKIHKDSQRFIGLWDTERVIYDDLRGSGRFWIALRPRCPILRQGAEPSNLDRMGWSGTGVQREIPVSYGKVL